MLIIALIFIVLLNSEHVCVYDAGWKWRTSKPSNFCCRDADCPAGGTNNLVKGKCKSPGGTGGTPHTYTCDWPACKSNADCVDGACCGSKDAGGPGDPISGNCVSVGYATGAYLCARGSEARWVECNEDNVGSTTEVNSVTYVCSVENGNYKWIEEESIKTPKLNILDLIVQFFKNILQFFFQM